MRDQIITRSSAAKQAPVKSTPEYINTSAVPSLPSEIWWRVSLELAAEGDFGSLYTLTRLSQGLANLALPLLYRYQENSAASNDIFNIKSAVSLWRSIISSGLGKTQYPYCTWIKTLELSKFASLLEDLRHRSRSALQKTFFRPPLDVLHLKRSKSDYLDIDAITIKVGDIVTGRVEEIAKRENKLVALTGIETLLSKGFDQALPSWIPRLSGLTSLKLGAGEILSQDLAVAIRDNCPAFKELYVPAMFCQCQSVFFSNARVDLVISVLGIPSTLPLQASSRA